MKRTRAAVLGAVLILSGSAIAFEVWATVNPGKVKLSTAAGPALPTITAPPSPPTKLSSGLRLSIVNAVRKQLKKAPVTTVIAPTVVLNPAMPSRPGGTMSALSGSDGELSWASGLSGIRLISFKSGANIFLSFTTIPRKTYLLDCSVNSLPGDSKQWRVQSTSGSSTTEQTVVSQDWHVLAAIRAQSSTTDVVLSRPDSTKRASLFECTWTPVD